MPRYLTLGTLTQDGYDNMEEGPETVEQFMEMVNSMDGRFEAEDFYVLQGEYDWAAILELPTHEAAARLAHVYARTGRGRMHVQTVLGQGPEGYAEYVESMGE